MNKILFYLISFSFITTQLRAQVDEPRRFYSNVVEIGSHDFGLITGQDKRYYYFICIRPLNFNSDKPIDSVHFYLSKFIATANRVKNFQFGSSYTVALYQCEKDPNNKWQDKYYGFSNQGIGQLRTYFDDNIQDSLWSISFENISINEVSVDGLLRIKVPAGSDAEIGMPIIADYGSIVGIFAQKGDQGTLINAIDINSIADQIFKYDPICRYFNMIEYGKTDTRCNTESKIVIKEDNPSSTDLATYKFINFGIFGNLMFGFPQPGAEVGNGDGTGMYNYGLSLYFNIDPMNYRRLTFKIGTGRFSENFASGIWNSSDNLATLVSSEYKFINLPLTYEFEIYRSSHSSGSIGLGFSPYFTFKQSAVIKNNSSGMNYLYKIDQNGMAHRLIAELHFVEWDNIRIGLNGGRDLTKFPNPYHVFNLNGVSYKPYEQRKDTWYVGLEMSIRITGNWGVRNN